MGLFASPPGLLVCGLGAISAWIAWRGRRRLRRAVPALLSLWLCLGILRALLWQLHADHHLRALVPPAPSSIKLHGVLLEDPVARSNPDGRTAHAGVVDLRHLDTGAGWQPRSGRVRVSWSDREVAFAYGDELLLEGAWERPPTPGNPGQHDWRAALARRRIHAIMQVKPFDGVVVLQRGQGWPWLAGVYGLRRRWEALMHATFDARDIGLLSSLLLGQRAALDE